MRIKAVAPSLQLVLAIGRMFLIIFIIKLKQCFHGLKKF